MASLSYYGASLVAISSSQHRIAEGLKPFLSSPFNNVMRPPQNAKARKTIKPNSYGELGVLELLCPPYPSNPPTNDEALYSCCPCVLHCRRKRPYTRMGCLGERCLPVRFLMPLPRHFDAYEKPLLTWHFLLVGVTAGTTTFVPRRTTT